MGLRCAGPPELSFQPFLTRGHRHGAAALRSRHPTEPAAKAELLAHVHLSPSVTAELYRRENGMVSGLVAVWFFFRASKFLLPRLTVSARYQ